MAIDLTEPGDCRPRSRLSRTASYFTAVGVASFVIYLFVCAAAYYEQGHLIYLTPLTSKVSPGFSIQVPGALLKISHSPMVSPKALIVFGGNGEDASRSLAAYAQAFPERAVFVMNYRGYGESTGTPAEKDLNADALVLFDRVVASHPEVLVIGRSLGSGVAVRLAAARPVSRLVLVTPYDSLLEVASRVMPGLPVSLLLKDKWESITYAPTVSAPTTILVADDDMVILPERSEALLKAFKPGVATMVRFPGRDQINLSSDPKYVEAMGW